MGCNNLGSSCVQSDRGQAWTPRQDFAVSKSLAQPVTVGSVAFEKAGATPNHDLARASAARSNGSECTTSGVSMYFRPQNCGAVLRHLPTTRCAEDNRRLLRFSNGF